MKEPESILDTALIALEQQSTILNGLLFFLLFRCNLRTELNPATYNPMSLNLVIQVGSWVRLASMGSEWAKLLGAELCSIAKIVVPVHEVVSTMRK